MTRRLLDINADTGTLTRAADAGAAHILKGISGLMDSGPVDPDLELLIREVKGFENSLKDTVLDTSDEVIAAALMTSDPVTSDPAAPGQRTDTFLAETVTREKKRLHEQAGKDRKTDTSTQSSGPYRKIQNPPFPEKGKTAAKETGRARNNEKKTAAVLPEIKSGPVENPEQVSAITLAQILAGDQEISRILSRKEDNDKNKATGDLFKDLGPGKIMPAVQGKQINFPADIGSEKIKEKNSDRYRFKAWFENRIHRFNPAGDNMPAPAIGGRQKNGFKQNKTGARIEMPVSPLPVTLESKLRHIIQPDATPESKQRTDAGSIRSAPLGRSLECRTKNPVLPDIASGFFDPFDPADRVDTGGRWLKAEQFPEPPSTLAQGGGGGPRTTGPGGIPDELKTAVQWMAEEEVENKLVEMLRRQAKLRGVDLS